MIKRRQRPDMTIAFNWDTTHQFKQPVPSYQQHGIWPLTFVHKRILYNNGVKMEVFQKAIFYHQETSLSVPQSMLSSLAHSATLGSGIQQLL